MNRRTRIAASTLIGAGLLAGGFGAAAALTGGDADDDAPITGSVTAPPDHEDAALQELATISPEEAGAAAIDSVGGTVTNVEIDDEDGFVVYEVEVDTPGGTVEVIVDAGNGSVLAEELDDDDDDHGDSDQDDDDRDDDD